MKKYSTLLLLLALTMMYSITAWSAESEMSITPEKPFYKSFTGTITAVDEHHSIANGLFISLESEDGQPANFVISEDTFIENGLTLETGKKVTGYYDATRPMIMIYPPQYTIEVVVRADNDDRLNVFVGYFDQNHISFDNRLHIKPSENTTIITKDGEPFTGSLQHKKLLVYYGASTRSIPAQTTPDTVIVLDQYFRSIGDAERTQVDMMIANTLFSEKPMYLTDTAMVYVPLRFTAESLGFPVVWQGHDQPLLIGNQANLTVGNGDYKNLDGKTVTLRYVPEIRKNETFVPLSFFREILQINNAFYFEGRIEINNDERFE